jgi:signal transduction histidine kinase
MKIIGRRPPRRRDPRRRFRNRLLLGMVVVALLPLVAFAVLAVFELDTVAKSTANATESAILQRQQGLQSGQLNAQANTIDGRMRRIDNGLETLGFEMTTALKGAATQPLPKPEGVDAGAQYSYQTLTGGLTDALIVRAGDNSASDLKFAVASQSAAVTSQIAAMKRQFNEIISVWIADDGTGALRTFSQQFRVPDALSSERYNIQAPGDRDGQSVFQNAEGGITSLSPNVWVDPAAPSSSAEGPFWTDPYPLLEGGENGVENVGVSARLELNDGRTFVGVDVSPTALLAGALGSVPSANASSLVVSANGVVVFAGTSANNDFPNTAVSTKLNVPAAAALGSALDRMELTGSILPSPIPTTLQGVKDDVFAAPIYSGHWVITNQVPVSQLEPNLSSLTLGVNDSVHRLFPVTVLPVLVLLVVLAFIATTLLSRRMYLPVQALTDHAVLEERTRLAREIHDTLAQQLTGIVLELEAADTLLNRGSEGRARSSVEKARELARGALQEARRSVWNLRPAPLAATGLVAAIGHEVEAWEERTGVPARFKARAVPQHPSLSPTAEVALLRIGQEALSNVARHGRAAHVDVELRAHAQELVLSVRDDGIGFDPAASAPRDDCFGLDGMAERARNAGGTLTVVSSPGQGTTVTTRLPLTEPGIEANTA